MYGKVYKSMFHGSMYGNPDGIITMMVLIALADREGYVDMTPQAIAATTSIPLGIIERGLEYLARTDPASRTPAEDGRRIVLIDEHRPWGWKIVNYQHYRDLRNEEARREQWRQAKRRERSGAAKSTKVNGVSTRVNAVHNVHPSYLDADAEVSEKQKISVPTEPHSGEPETDPVFRVFEHWKQAHSHPQARLDAKRRKLIRAALDGYTEADLCQSITGYLSSPHHMGQNDRATKYDGIELLLRDAKHIDAGLAFYRDPPPTHLSKLTRKNVDATRDWVPPEMRNGTG